MKKGQFMRREVRSWLPRSLVAISMIALSACGSQPTTAADERAIRDADDQYNAAIVQRDLDNIMSMYAPNAVSMSPGDPPERGLEAIRAAWTSLLAVPEFKLRIIPEKIEVAHSGEMALELGYNEVEGMFSTGPVKARANYVVGWRKIDGRWKITHETFVPEKPIPPPSTAEPKK